MRILIADNHSIFRIGLKHVLGGLRGGIRVVEADGIDDAIEAIESAPSIDLAIVELSAPGMDGGNGIARLCSRQVDLPVIVVAADVTRAAALRAVERGAMGLVPKTVTGEEVLEAIDTVMEGRVWLPKAAVGPAGRAALNEAPGGCSDLDTNGLDRMRNLTRRQREVLERLVEGKSNAAVARDLGLAEGTVRIHVSAILKTLNVGNRTQAAILANRYFKD
jgi:DNA-binding NarL/FixJ family response regulator